MSRIKKRTPRLKIITSVKDFVDTNKNKVLENIMEIDMFASDVYTLGYDYEPLANLDYTKKMITKK